MKMNTKFSIYTEKKNYYWLTDLISKFHNGFTIIENNGFWKNESENSLKIEIIANELNIYNIRYICERIKEHNKQEAILLTIEKIESELI